MSTYFDGDDEIRSAEVIEYLDNLRDTRDNEMLVTVVFVSTGTVLGNFGSQEDAEEFIDDEDYVRALVRIDEKDSEVDGEELTDLEAFNRDGENEFGSEWADGITLRREDAIDAAYGEDYALRNGFSVDDELSEYVDWEEWIRYRLIRGEPFVRLDGIEYYRI